MIKYVSETVLNALRDRFDEQAEWSATELGDALGWSAPVGKLIELMHQQIVSPRDPTPADDPMLDIWTEGEQLQNRFELEQQRASRHAATRPEARRYIRQGPWCSCERSKSVTGDFELGVSAYRSQEVEGGWQAIDGCFWVLNWGMTRSDTPYYLVAGEDVGSGSDGEVVLKNVRVEAWLNWNEAEGYHSVVSDLADNPIADHEECARKALE